MQKNQNMKKVYINPTMHLHELKHKHHVLAGSLRMVYDVTTSGTEDLDFDTDGIDDEDVIR